MKIEKLKKQLEKLSTDDLTHIRAWLGGLLSVRKYHNNLTDEQKSERGRAIRAGKSYKLGVAFPDNIEKYDRK